MGILGHCWWQNRISAHSFLSVYEMEKKRWLNGICLSGQLLGLPRSTGEPRHLGEQTEAYRAVFLLQLGGPPPPHICTGDSVSGAERGR